MRWQAFHRVTIHRELQKLINVVREYIGNK